MNRRLSDAVGALDEDCIRYFVSPPAFLEVSCSASKCHSSGKHGSAILRNSRQTHARTVLRKVAARCIWQAEIQQDARKLKKANLQGFGFSFFCFIFRADYWSRSGATCNGVKALQVAQFCFFSFSFDCSIKCRRLAAPTASELGGTSLVIASATLTSYCFSMLCCSPQHNALQINLSKMIRNIWTHLNTYEQIWKQE